MPQARKKSATESQSNEKQMHERLSREKPQQQAENLKSVSQDTTEALRKTAQSAADMAEEGSADTEGLIQDYNHRLVEAFQEYGSFMLDYGQRSLRDGFEALNGMSKVRTWQDIARFQQEFYWRQVTKMIQDSSRAVEIGLSSGDRLAKAVRPHLERMANTMQRASPQNK